MGLIENLQRMFEEEKDIEKQKNIQKAIRAQQAFQRKRDANNKPKKKVQ